MATAGSKEETSKFPGRGTSVDSDPKKTKNDIPERGTNANNLMVTNVAVERDISLMKLEDDDATNRPPIYAEEIFQRHSVIVMNRDMTFTRGVFEESYFSFIELHPDAINRTHEVLKTVTSSGGHIKLGDCTIDVPENALSEKMTVELKLQYRNKRRNEVNRWKLFGPIILFSTLSETSSPHLAPGSRIIVKVPTCYFREDDASVNVKVDRSSWSPLVWEEYQKFPLPRDGLIEFIIHGPSNLDRSYRFLIRMRGCIKSVAHMMFALEHSENSYELIWCFCDNLKEAKLELQKNMKAREYFMINQAKEFLMSENDSFVAYLEIPEGSVDKPTQTIESNLLWSSDSFEELSFTVENLKEGGNIKYKIEKMKTSKEKPSSGGEEKMFQFHNNAGETELYFI